MVMIMSLTKLEKDKEALNVYINESIKSRIKQFDNIEEKIDYLVKNNYFDLYN